MSLDFEAQQTLGVMAGTLAQYLKDNDKPEPDQDGVGDADEYGMYAMATGFLRMYYELLRLKEIVPPEQVGMKAPTHHNPGGMQ